MGAIMTSGSEDHLDNDIRGLSAEELAMISREEWDELKELYLDVLAKRLKGVQKAIEVLRKLGVDIQLKFVAEEGE